ncbi:hypothetical protein STAL104432_29450 [Streptomyces albus]
MTADVERDGYTAELTEDDLEIVYRGPRGRQLKKCPAQLAGAPGMAELSAVRRTLTAHRAACEEQALVWAKEGAHAPRALAEADPEWERALTAAGVPLTGEPGEDGLFARTYAGPHGRTLTQLLAEDVVPYRDMLMREDAWEPAGLFATGLPDPAPDADGRLPFPERVLAAHPHQQGLALEKIRALERESAGWRYVFKKDMDDVLAGLESTAPALAVSLLDEMADFALGTGDLAEAAAWFGRARKAERNAGRTPDHTWLYTRCLRYARGGGAVRDGAAGLGERTRHVGRSGGTRPRPVPHGGARPQPGPGGRPRRRAQRHPPAARHGHPQTRQGGRPRCGRGTGHHDGGAAGTGRHLAERHPVLGPVLQGPRPRPAGRAVPRDGPHRRAGPASAWLRLRRRGGVVADAADAHRDSRATARRTPRAAARCGGGLAHRLRQRPAATQPGAVARPLRTGRTDRPPPRRRGRPGRVPAMGGPPLEKQAARPARPDRRAPGARRRGRRPARAPRRHRTVRPARLPPPRAAPSAGPRGLPAGGPRLDAGRPGHDGRRRHGGRRHVVQQVVQPARDQGLVRCAPPVRHLGRSRGAARVVRARTGTAALGPRLRRARPAPGPVRARRWRGRRAAQGRGGGPRGRGRGRRRPADARTARAAGPGAGGADHRQGGALLRQPARRCHGQELHPPPCGTARIRPRHHLAGGGRDLPPARLSAGDGGQLSRRSGPSGAPLHTRHPGRSRSGAPRFLADPRRAADRAGDR